MNATERYKSLGIPSWYHGHAAQYERMFRNLDWPLELAEGKEPPLT